MEQMLAIFLDESWSMEPEHLSLLVQLTMFNNRAF